MIARYSTPEMSRLWSEEYKLALWQRVELAVCEAWHANGQIPAQALQDLKNSQPVRIASMQAHEATLKHETLAFLAAWKEQFVATASDAGKYLHLGMTSSDLLDTAQSLQIKDSIALLLEALDELLATLKGLALEHKYTPCIGRTHGVHAELSSFGLKFLLWYDELSRTKSRLQSARTWAAVAQFSGAVGNYSNITPAIEQHAADLLGLPVAAIGTQIVSRDRVADYLYAVATLGNSIEKIATELRHLQRTEVGELEEDFSQGQQGSSAMPHKRNPWRSENLCGLARLLRAYLQAALENTNLWHERDMSNSSVERVILPDASCLGHFMIERLHRILQHLTINRQRMQENIDLTRGCIFSQNVLLELVAAGLSREEAYAIVQELAHSLRPEYTLKDALLADPRINQKLSTAQLEACFGTERAFRHIEQIFVRVLGAGDPGRTT